MTNKCEVDDINNNFPWKWLFNNHQRFFNNITITIMRQIYWMDPINFYERDFCFSILFFLYSRPSIYTHERWIYRQLQTKSTCDWYCCVDKHCWTIYVCRFSSKPQSDCHTVQNKINIFYTRRARSDARERALYLTQWHRSQIATNFSRFPSRKILFATTRFESNAFCLLYFYWLLAFVHSTLEACTMMCWEHNAEEDGKTIKSNMEVLYYIPTFRMV